MELVNFLIKQLKVSGLINSFTLLILRCIFPWILLTFLGEKSCCLTFSARGFACLHAQSSKNQNIVNLSFETSKLIGKLIDVAEGKVIPILECAPSAPLAVFLYQLGRKISSNLDSPRKLIFDRSF